MICVCQQRRQGVGKELEDGLSKSGSKNKERHNELNQNTNNHGLPIDVLAVSTGDIKAGEEDQVPENTHGPIAAVVVGRFSWDEDTEKKRNNYNKGSSRSAMLLRDNLFHNVHTMAPAELEWTWQKLALQFAVFERTYTNT